MRKIILMIEISICIVAIVFAFFYGTIYSESIQKTFPFFFSSDETLMNESDMIGIEGEVETEGMEKGNIEEEINDFFKDGETLDEDLGALTPEGEEGMTGEEGIPSEESGMMPEMPSVPESGMEIPAESEVSSEIEGIKQNGAGVPQMPEIPETLSPLEQPILIPGEQFEQEDIGEIQQIEETDLEIPSNAEEVQIEIGNEPVKIEGIKGIESEEIDLEDLEEMQQQEINVDSDLIDL